LRNRLGVGPEAPILLTVGRMDPEKRLDFIVDAFVKISERHPNGRLVFAGDGSARKGLEEKVAKTSVKERIHFLGMVDRADLPDVFHDATVFLSASTTEVHPISVIEAIASGLPMVAVEDEAFEGMIEQGLNGYMVKLDVNEFADTVSDLLADRDKVEQFGRHSAMLSGKYSIEEQVKALEKLYMEAILQNWRGKFFDRFMPKEFDQLSRRIGRRITGIIPGRSKEKSK
jgi:1,2-diacylglycerol 3-alpha-glucosyltransferase